MLWYAELWQPEGCWYVTCTHSKQSELSWQPSISGSSEPAKLIRGNWSPRIESHYKARQGYYSTVALAAFASYPQLVLSIVCGWIGLNFEDSFVFGQEINKSELPVHVGLLHVHVKVLVCDFHSCFKTNFWSRNFLYTVESWVQSYLTFGLSRRRGA